MDETEDGLSEDRPKVCSKDMIGRDEDGPSEVCPKVRLKDMIGRDKDGPSEVPPKESDWTKKESGPCDDASTCMSCQNGLIGRDGIWSYLLETLLIGWSD